MIVCTLDGKMAYPSSSDKIKVTYENQYVKDSGSYTYDITFPMDIAANRKIFGNVQRIDVKKTIADFETCRLYAGNRLVMSGKGTVTSITPEKVKVQIVGGKSRIKYNSKFEKHFIDMIEYPTVILDSGVDTDTLPKFGYAVPFSMDNKNAFLPIDLTKSNFVGQKGVAVLAPVNDETNDVQANRVMAMKGVTLKTNGHKLKGDLHVMINLALQPYLFYILKKVMEYEGYSIVKNDYDKEPWNRLVIVSACKSGKIKDALPHWTVYKFIDELRKFFNCSFIFDEVAKTVSISATNELLTNDTVSYECEDDFSVEHDDDGLDNLATSNIEYNFDSAANRDWREYISQSVFKQYKTKEYDTVAELNTAAEKMTDRERRTTIFKVGHIYFVWAELPKDGNPDNEETEWRRTACGYFNPIIRDINSDSSQQLNICPAAMYQRHNLDGDDKKKKWIESLFDSMGDRWIVVPSVTNEKEASVEDMGVDDDGNYYITVQDTMQGSSDDSSSSEESDDTRMPVAFQANCVVNRASHAAVTCDEQLDNEDTDYRAPVLYTDYRMYPDYIVSAERASLSLEYTPANTGRTFGNGNRTFGNLGRDDNNSRFKTTPVDAHDLISFKFITDDIPDPSKIFIFHNKRYICKKIEMNVTDDGIDKEKTGYFYEIL